VTITEFLTARLDEDEHDWRVVGARQVVDLLHGKPLARLMLADVAAKRAIVELAAKDLADADRVATDLIQRSLRARCRRGRGTSTWGRRCAWSSCS
jgi:hypothetical protein